MHARPRRRDAYRAGDERDSANPQHKHRGAGSGHVMSYFCDVARSANPDLAVHVLVLTGRSDACCGHASASANDGGSTECGETECPDGQLGRGTATGRDTLGAGRQVGDDLRGQGEILVSG